MLTRKSFFISELSIFDFWCYFKPGAMLHITDRALRNLSDGRRVSPRRSVELCNYRLAAGEITGTILIDGLKFQLDSPEKTYLDKGKASTGPDIWTVAVMGEEAEAKLWSVFEGILLDEHGSTEQPLTPELRRHLKKLLGHESSPDTETVGRWAIEVIRPWEHIQNVSR